MFKKVIIKQGTGSIDTLLKGFRETYPEAEVIDIDEEKHETIQRKFYLFGEAIYICLGHVNTLALANLCSINNEQNKNKVFYMVAANSYGLPPKFKNNLLESKENYKFIDIKIITPSMTSKEVIEKELKNEFEVYCVPHGLLSGFYGKNIEDIKSKSLKVHWKKHGAVFLHVTSTHYKRKGTSELIRAFKKASEKSLKSYDKPCHLMILCNKNIIYEIHDQVVKNEAHNCNIRIQPKFGEYTEEEYQNFVKSHHCVVQPSYHEGFGLVPLEAYSLGIPQIVTACAGHNTYLSELKESVKITMLNQKIESDDYSGAEVQNYDEKLLEQAMVDWIGENINDWNPIQPDDEILKKWAFKNQVKNHLDKWF